MMPSVHNIYIYYAVPDSWKQVGCALLSMLQVPWYYILYDEGQPHIRLRLASTDETKYANILQKLTTWASAQPYPLQCVGKGQTTMPDIYECAEVQAEMLRHFCLSSKICVQQLCQEGAEVNPMVEAFALQWVFVMAAFDDRDQQSRFLEAYARYWLPLAKVGDSLDHLIPYYREKGVLPLAKKLSQMVKNQRLESYQLDEWYQETRSICKTISQFTTAPYEMLCMEMLHMTYNRLGIYNHDESLLAYRAYRALASSSSNA